MAKPSDFSATLMAQLAIALAKEGVEPNDVDVLCARKEALRAFPQLARGEAEVMTKRILTPLGIVKLDAQPKFVVPDNFKLDTSDSAVVKIGFIWDDFLVWFYNLVEDETEETELKYHKLERNARANEVFNELGENTAVKLSQIFALMRKQPNGGDGTLLTNGHANLFKLRDAKGKLRVVRVSWDADRGYWFAFAFPFAFPFVWSAGSRVFS